MRTETLIAICTITFFAFLMVGMLSEQKQNHEYRMAQLKCEQKEDTSWLSK